ncbi:MAG: FAD/NAD(P)-binding protein [Thioalkalispiraceae bacterium]|jgi:NAD(P)H-flavin reductase
MMNPRLPLEAEIIERIQESPSLFTLRLQFTDPKVHAAYQFEPGQFNMLYLYGVGEVPISIVSDPMDEHVYDHTIRAVGRVTKGLSDLKQGQRIGVRGPYGRGWPMEQAEQKDVVIVTGGLGCAPTVSVINYIMKRRERFGAVNIVQGVKHANDFIWKERYDQWRQASNTQVLLAADAGNAIWPWHIGPVTGLFDQLDYDPERVIVMMCGPEGMMRVVIKHMLEQGIGECDLWLSMERNMQCAVGHCGHCQYGEKFVCKDGPVFCYEQVKELFGLKGF